MNLRKKILLTLIILSPLQADLATKALCDTIISSPFIGTSTWTVGGSPYIITTSTTLDGTLTIEAGVTVKFQSGKSLQIGYTDVFGDPHLSTIKILGTPSSFVLITADSTTPTAGFWSGITLKKLAPTPSIIQYAQIEYANTAVFFDNVSADVHSTVIRNTSGSAIKTLGNVVLNMYQNSFSSNGKAIEIGSPTSTTSITSIFSWWGHISGPSGAGSGTGQFATTGTKFEPWIETAPVYTNELNTASIVNRTFNPNGGINNHVNFGSFASASWTFTYLNSSSQIIRTFSGSGQSTNIVWDGKNDSGVLQASATYTYRIQSSGSATATGKVIMSLTQTPAISGATVNPAFFSPDGDAYQNTTTISANFNFDGGQWTVNIKNSGGTIVRTQTASGLTFSWVWDGKNSSGVVQPDGVYTVEIKVTDDTANLTNNQSTTLDVTDPVASITYPTASLVFSNIYQNNSVGVTGSATDLNFNDWRLLKCTSSCPTTLASGTTQKTNALFFTWNTAVEGNANLNLKLEVKDKAGNLSIATVGLTVGNYSLSQNSRQMNPSAGQTVTYTSVIPFSLNEQILIKNAAGQTVRTLFNGPRNAGTFPNSFDGRDASNNLLPDGPYFVIANITAGSYNLAWDQTNQFVGGVGNTYYPPSTANFDPYNNVPLSMTYNLPDPRRVTIAVGAGQAWPEVCAPPMVCLIVDEYQESGPHTFVYYGVDTQGSQEPGMRNMGARARLVNFSKNAVVLFGIKPKVTNVLTSPALFNPVLGNQTITFTLSTYQNQPANVTVTFLNQSSNSILRTINLPSVAVGTVQVIWDGKADNGIRVSPDPYWIKITATDSRGQQAIGETLTSVR